MRGPLSVRLLRRKSPPGRPSGRPHHDTPVLLVHGFAHNRSGWFVVSEHLRRAGFTNVHTWNYDPFRHDIPELAEMLSDRVELLKGRPVPIASTSWATAWAASCCGGTYRSWAATPVSPPPSPSHRRIKAPMATFIPGRTGRIATELAPGSWLLRRLERGARATTVRWVAFYPPRPLRATVDLGDDHGSGAERHERLHQGRRPPLDHAVERSRSRGRRRARGRRRSLHRVLEVLVGVPVSVFVALVLAFAAAS